MSLNHIRLTSKNIYTTWIADINLKGSVFNLCKSRLLSRPFGVRKSPQNETRNSNVSPKKSDRRKRFVTSIRYRKDLVTKTYISSISWDKYFFPSSTPNRVKKFRIIKFKMWRHEYFELLSVKNVIGVTKIYQSIVNV